MSTRNFDPEQSFQVIFFSPARMPLHSQLERNVRGNLAAKVGTCPRSQLKDSALFSPLHAEGWTDRDSNPIGDGLQSDSSLLPRTLFLLGYVLVFIFHVCLWISGCLCG